MRESIPESFRYDWEYTCGMEVCLVVSGELGCMAFGL